MCNIYLDRLDKYMERKKKEFDKGERKKKKFIISEND